MAKLTPGLVFRVVGERKSGASRAGGWRLLRQPCIAEPCTGGGDGASWWKTT